MSSDTLPSGALLTGIQCSTAHITDGDNPLLYHASHQQEEYGHGEWLHFTGTGYLIRLNACHLRRLGGAKACRRLVVTLMNHHPIAFLNLDAAGDILSGIEAFDW